jgi:hypothetical protein
VQLLAEASESVTTVAEAAAAVADALAAPDALSPARRRVAADLFYRPGTASARCALELYDVLELAPPSAIVTTAREVTPWLRSA